MRALLPTLLLSLTGLPAIAVEPYFSEYVEGSSNNKAVEIANPGPGPLDLSGYRLEVYFNGSLTASINHIPTAVLPSGEVYVFAHGSSAATILAVADATTGSGLWNGDDALVLRRLSDNAVIDSIGQVGVDPGSAWSGGGVSTADRTLRRTTAPDYDATTNDAFDPSLAWTGFPVDTFDDLGVGSGGGGLPTIVIGGSATVSESAGTITVSLTRSTALDEITIALSTSPGGTIADGGVTLGIGVLTADVILPITDDAVQDGDQVITVTASADGYTAGSLNVIVADDDVPTVAIHAVQGAAHASPFTGLVVQVADAVVTARDARGFWMQEPDAENDADAATSEAVYVFTSTAPTAQVGDLVAVRGRVVEFYPDGASGDGLAFTEMSNVTVSVLSSGNPLPTPVVIGSAGRQPPTTTIDDDAFGSFDPASDGIDFYESLEGMLVAIDDAVVVGATNSFGEIWVLPDNGTSATSRSEHGGARLTANDANPERIQVEDYLVDGEPQADVGDSFPGRITGVLHYNFDNYRVYNTAALPVLVDGGLVPETTSLPGHPLHNLLRQVRIATINVENLFAADPRVTDHARAIVERLDSPLIVALEEIQDASGPTNNGVTDGTPTGAALVAAITTLGGPAYQYIEIAPVDGQDGGQPGGNIRQAFLYRAPVTLKPGVIGDALTPIQVLADGTLDLSLGRIDPTNPVFSNSRKPLVATFRLHSREVVVIANHWNSKGGDQPLMGRFQPPTLTSEVQRLGQAQVVAGFVDQLLDRDPQALVAVVGDLNDFAWSAPVQKLVAAGMKPLDDLLPAAARYSYVFQGNSQTLDHLLASPAFTSLAPAIDIVHSNSEFASQISDHDPSIMRLTVIPRIPRWLAALLWPRPLDANG